MRRLQASLRFTIVLAVALGGCDDPSRDVDVRSRSADLDADASIEPSADQAPAENEEEHALDEDVIARYWADTQTLAIIEGWQDTATQAMDLIWTTETSVVFASSGETADVVLLSEEEQPTLVPPEEQEKKGLKLYINAKCVKTRDAFVGKCWSWEGMTGSVPDDAIGLSWTNSFHKLHKCKRGKSECVERVGVDVVHTFYANDDCTGAVIDIQPTYTPVCNPPVNGP